MKTYIKPEVLVVPVNTNHSLLAGSLTESTNSAESMDGGSFGARQFDFDFEDEE